MRKKRRCTGPPGVGGLAVFAHVMGGCDVYAFDMRTTFVGNRLRLAVGVVAAMAAISMARGQAAPAEHFPTNDDLRHVKAVSAPKLSPDGKQVLFIVTEATADGAKAHLWVGPVDGKEKPRQITFGPQADKRGEHGAAWAPDGSAIYFTAHRGEHTQLFRLDLRGGEAQPFELKVTPVVDASKEKDAIPPAGADKKDEAKKDDAKKDEAKKTDEKKDAAPEPLEIDVAGYAVSDDGKWLAVWADDPETPGEKKQKDAKADAEWVDHDKHGTRLYVAALKADGTVDGSLKPVAIAPDVRTAEWSPAEDRLLVLTEAPNNAGDLGPAGAAWTVLAAEPEKATKLEAIPATVEGGAFSPNGTSLVFAAQTPEDAPPGYAELFALAWADKSAKPVRLAAGFKGQLSRGATFLNESTVVADAEIGVRGTAVRVALDGKQVPQEVALGSAVISGLDTNRKQTGWVWLAQGSGAGVKLCHAATLGAACTALPLPELEPEGLKHVKPELVKWQSDGFTVEGLLYLPAEASATHKVPLIVDVHGGPFGGFNDRDDLFAAFLVGHGWAILRPNPRGSSGYGVAFAAANKNDLGGGDYRDVMAGADAVLKQYPLDAERTALMGYSYGGEMAGFVVGKTDRFKAIISGAPVIDQFSEYGTESQSWYDQWYFGKPWEHMADAWRQSPLAGASKAKTPFLLLQGEADTTDPVGQSLEMYRALRQAGAPVELVTYPRENHGPLAGGMFGRPVPEPWHGFDARQRVVAFLEKYLGASK